MGRRAGAGQPRNEVIAAVAREYGLRRREVYDAVLAARRPGPGRPGTQGPQGTGIPRPPGGWRNPFGTCPRCP